MKSKVHYWRVKQNMTVKELQEASGLSVVSIMNIEKGKRFPRVLTIRSIAQALAIPPQELVTTDDDSDADGPHQGSSSLHRRSLMVAESSPMYTA